MILLASLGILFCSFPISHGKPADPVINADSFIQEVLSQKTPRKHRTRDRRRSKDTHLDFSLLSGLQAFVPLALDKVAGENEMTSIFKSSGVVRAISLALVLVFGFPLYLLTHFGGREYEGWANHLNPWSPVFLPKERFEVFLSDLGLMAVIGSLFLIGQQFGFATVLKTYIIPYFIVHVWLVTITFLHHSNPKCPHYNKKEWIWLKGALSTIDRDFGFLNVIFHRITDTHVLHHLFSQVSLLHPRWTDHILCADSALSCTGSNRGDQTRTGSLLQSR